MINKKEITATVLAGGTVLLLTTCSVQANESNDLQTDISLLEENRVADNISVSDNKTDKESKINDTLSYSDTSEEMILPEENTSLENEIIIPNDQDDQIGNKKSLNINNQEIPNQKLDEESCVSNDLYEIQAFKNSRSNHFVDVKPSEWFYQIVELADSSGIMTGINSTHFAPYETMTRSMAATAIYRLANSPQVSYVSYFEDVPNNLWYSKPITWAKEHKIISGYSGELSNTFGPDNSLTREQFAVIIRNFAIYCGILTATNQSLNEFTDGNDTAPYARSAVNWIAGNSIIDGMQIHGKTYLKPQETCTRAQCAKILYYTEAFKNAYENGFIIKDSHLIKYTGSSKIIQIPVAVKEIDQGVFENNKNIQEVRIPGNTLKIGKSAFKNCTNLKSVYFSEGLQSIEDEAFENTALESVTLPHSLAFLGKDVFKDCKNLKSIQYANRVNGYSHHGKLHVENGKLKDQNNEVVQLKGVSTHGINWFPQYVNQSDFNDLFNQWNANVVRLALYVTDYNGYCSGRNQTQLRNLVEEGIEYALKSDMYVIVDWHILSDGNPLDHVDTAKVFFNEISKKYKNHNNIIYEICNEPNGSGGTWANIKNYANQVIPIIRNNNKDAVILVGTPNWDQELQYPMQDPLPYNNLMYTLHFYAATHKEALRNIAKTALQHNVPIFVSEFGICDASGTGGIDINSGDAWMKLLNQYQVSYCKWNLSNKNETSAMIKSSCTKTSGFTENDLTDSGKWYLQQLDGKLLINQSGNGDNPQNNDKDSQNDSDTDKVQKSETVSGTKIQIDKANSWKEGSKTNIQYSVTLHNTSSEPKSGWSFTITFDSVPTIRNHWNCNVSVSGKTVTVSNVDYNKNIGVNQSVSDIGLIIAF